MLFDSDFGREVDPAARRPRAAGDRRRAGRRRSRRSPPRSTRVQSFLRAETAGRAPGTAGAGERAARLHPAARRRARAHRRPRSVPDARASDRAVVRGRPARAAAAAEPAEHLPGAARRPRCDPAGARRPQRRGPSRACMLLNRVLTVRRRRGRLAPAARLGGRHRAGHPRARRPRQRPLVAILWGKDAAGARPAASARRP